MFHAAVVRVPAVPRLSLKHAAVRLVAQDGRRTRSESPPARNCQRFISLRGVRDRHSIDGERMPGARPRRAHCGDFARDRGEARGLSLAADASAPAALYKTLHCRQAPEIELLHIRTHRATHEEESHMSEHDPMPGMPTPCAAPARRSRRRAAYIAAAVALSVAAIGAFAGSSFSQGLRHGLVNVPDTTATHASFEGRFGDFGPAGQASCRTASSRLSSMPAPTA